MYIVLNYEFGYVKYTLSYSKKKKNSFFMKQIQTKANFCFFMQIKNINTLSHISKKKYIYERYFSTPKL
jgi:hypothetical protein